MGGDKVGHVSRCVWSPRLQKNIGFANLPAELTPTGTRLTIWTPGGEAGATVVNFPWFPAQKHIPVDIAG